MNRAVFITTGILACVAAAWIGWQAAQPAREKTHSEAKIPDPVPAPVSQVNYTSAADAGFDVRQGRTLDVILADIDRLRLDPVSQATADDSISGELFALLHSLTTDEIPGVLAHLVKGNALRRGEPQPGDRGSGL